MNKSNYAKAISSLVALALFATGCTKTREASLSEDAQETNFAISEIDTLSAQGPQLKITTDSELSTLSFGEGSKATAEKGKVAVISADVPKRLQFMFKNLQITGQAGHSYPIVLSVDRQHVTAYKVVSDASDLTILEKHLAQVKQEVLLQKQLQKTSDLSKTKALMQQLRSAKTLTTHALMKKDQQILVPLFKYPVQSYGVLQRVKNELKEETSNLRLKGTNWTEATHITLSVKSEHRVLVGLEPASVGEMDRTFVMDRINNKIMTADTLKNEFQVEVNMKPEARILTLLDVDALHVFEITQADKADLTESQKQQLRSASNKTNVRHCSEDIKKALPTEAQANCILVLRFDVPVNYVKPQLANIDEEGNQQARINFEQVRAGQSVGLVQIAKNVEPKRIEHNNNLDPRGTIRVADIKNKEFFFKRTLEDAPVTTVFPPGLAGNLTIVKFELLENRLVVRRADKLVDHKSGRNDVDFEELMSVAVKYLKFDTKNSSGAEYAMARLVPASHVDAEFIELDWTRNTLSSDYSPYDSLHSQCFRSVADSFVSDMDMKLDRGSLNFTLNYSVGLAADCIAVYNVADSYNGTANYQTTARLKERISFLANNGKTDKSFVEQVPFRVQNELGYGVWTIGQIDATATGLTGRAGQEKNFPVVHDFRNGKKLVYTVTGLEPSVDLPADIRQLYIETTQEVVAAWDLAYRQAFKGTDLARDGRYIEVQFAGENGINAKVGDLDKNIIHYENKFNSNHGILGVSQVGYNPRSGIVVADSMVVYAGNLQQFVAGSQRNLKIAEEYHATKEKFKKDAFAKLSAQQAAEAKAQKSVKADATPQEKAEAAANFTRQLAKMSQGMKPSKGAFIQAKNMKLSAMDVKSAVAQMKKSNTKNFAYSSPTTEHGWIDKVLKQLNENRSMDELELEGLVAKEMLAAKGKKMTASQRASLESTAKLGALRSKLNAQFKSRPGCMLTARNPISTGFAKMSFKEALKEELYFDLAHEMGHSQGLTHNFIGSYDKANFGNEDGSDSKRNYSSIMDYIEPGRFVWDGVGSYDVHALRASHLGLFELSPAAIQKLAKDPRVVNDKFITYQTLKEDVMENDLNNFSKRRVSGLLREYKYCTDIHVGYEPTCQRFDYGTTSGEIVDSLIQDYEDGYVNNYHSWDRNSFGVREASRAVSGSIRAMFNMRQFLDELFYTMVLDRDNQKAISENLDATLKAYLFYIQLVQTPDAHALFNDENRFVAVPYQYKETNAEGQETGKTITDIQVVERRSISDLAIRQDRIDTVGIEYDKIMALNFLTMKGFPEYKYWANSILFSFLDFEKYALGMKSENSLFVNLITGMLLDNIQPSFTNDKVTFFPLQGEKASVTSAMRSYAGIYSILNLEASTLRDKDNYATLFKVGSSVGKAPQDRLALSQLGVSDNSATRLSFWAVDNAVATNSVLQTANMKNFFIKNTEVIQAPIEKLVAEQVIGFLSEKGNAEKIAAAKAELTAKLNELNTNGMIASKAMVQANPQLSVEGQVAIIEQFNSQVINMTLAALTGQDVSEHATGLKNEADMMAEALPLLAVGQVALRSSMAKVGQQLSKTQGFEVLKDMGDIASQLVDGSQLEVSYGIIMKNIEFLNMLTLMTNPELNR